MESNNQKDLYFRILVHRFIIPLQYKQESSPKRQEAFIIIIDCDQQYLKEGQSCASEEHIEQFKKQINYISFNTYVSTFNTDEIKIKKISKQHLWCHFNCNKNSFVNVGVLFKDILNFNYIESYTSQYQLQDFEASIKLQGCFYYFGYYLRLSPIIINQGIKYQTIGEILAQVGSILTLLMMLRSLIEYYNAFILENMIQFQILSQWFPQQIKLNKYGVISSIAGYKSKVQLLKFKNIADSKLDIIDIIYQIQRIQLILIKKFGRDELLEAKTYVIQPHASLGSDFRFASEDQFYRDDLEQIQPVRDHIAHESQFQYMDLFFSQIPLPINIPIRWLFLKIFSDEGKGMIELLKKIMNKL